MDRRLTTGTFVSNNTEWVKSKLVNEGKTLNEKCEVVDIKEDK